MLRSLKCRLFIYCWILLIILYYLTSKSNKNLGDYQFRNDIVHMFVDETKLDNRRMSNILNCWLNLQSETLEIWIWKYEDVLTVLNMTLQQYKGIFQGLSKTRAMYVIPSYITQIFGGFFGFYTPSRQEIFLPTYKKFRKDTCYLYLPPSFFDKKKLYRDNDYFLFSIYCYRSHPFLGLFNRMIVLTRNEENLHDAVGWNILQRALNLASNLKEYKINPISVQSSRYLASRPNAILRRCQNFTSIKIGSIHYANDKLKVDRIKEYLRHM